MAGRYSNPVPQYLDDNGDPLPGGKLYFYVTGTTTPQDTYSNSALSTPNANPVILDSAGRAGDIFASYEDTYRVVLKTSADVTVWTRDNVQFSDVQQLTTLIEQIQADIDALSAPVMSIAAIANPSCDAAGVEGTVTLTTSLLATPVGGWWARVQSAVSAGTVTMGRLSGLGAIETQIKAAGVTGTSASVVEFVNYMTAEDAIRYANQTCSVSIAMRQESGLTATCTLAVYKANSINNFDATTLISSTATNVSTATNQTLTLDGVAMGDCSDGIKFVLTIAPGAGFTTKDFYATDLNFVISPTSDTYVAGPAALRRLAVFFKGLTGQYFFHSGATAPAGAVALDGSTIGNAASAATARANEDARDLYAHLWNTYDNTLAPVSSGRGSTANADFDANKTLMLFDLRGYFLRAVNTSGSGKDPSRALGSKQDDAMQGHVHGTNPDVSSVGSGVVLNGFLNGDGSYKTGNPEDDGTNGTPRTANETRPVNAAGLLCMYL